MQAITTKYLGPTETKGARIKASCTAGTKTYDYYDLLRGMVGRLVPTGRTLKQRGD